MSTASWWQRLSKRRLAMAAQRSHAEAQSGRRARLTFLSLEPRVLPSISAGWNDAAKVVTFAFNSAPNPNEVDVYLQTDASGFLTWSADGTTYTPDLDTSIAGDQTFQFSSGANLTIDSKLDGKLITGVLAGGTGSLTINHSGTSTIHDLTGPGIGTHTLGGVSFDSAVAVNAGSNTITFPTAHGFQFIQEVVYSVPAGGTAVGGLVDGTTYFAFVVNATTVKLLSSVAGIEMAGDLSTQGGAVSVTGTKIHLAADITTKGGNLTLNADQMEVDTTAGPILVSTRNVLAGADHATASSMGNSGTISIKGKKITIGSSSGSTGKASLFANAINVLGTTFTSGDVAMKVADVGGTDALDLTLADVDETRVSITLNDAAVKGGKVTLEASADHLRVLNVDTPEGLVDQGIETGISLLETFKLIAGVAISTVEAKVNLGKESVITADSLTATAFARSNASTTPIALGLGVAVAIADTRAEVNAAGDVTTTGNVLLRSGADNTLDARADASTAIKGGAAAVAVTVLDSVAKAHLTKDATYNVGGSLTVQADTVDRNVTLARSTTGADGVIGISVAVSDEDGNTSALIDGQVTTAGGVTVTAKQKKEPIAAQRGVLVPSYFTGVAASAGVNTDSTGDFLIDQKNAAMATQVTGRLKALGSKVITKIKGASDKVQENTKAKGQAAKFDVGAAVAVVRDSNHTTARIGDAANGHVAVVKAGGPVLIQSKVENRPDITAGSSITAKDPPPVPGDETKFAGSVAVAIGVYDNTASARIDAGSKVDSKGALTVKAEALNDYVFSFGKNLFDALTQDPTYTTDSGSVAIQAGDIVEVKDGHSAGGDGGNWYKYVGPAAGSTINLGNENFTNLANWEDMGPAWKARSINTVRTFSTYLDSNLGLDNNAVDSWSQATADGAKVSIAGALTVLDMDVTADAVIASNAQINQDAAYRSVGNQTVSVEAIGVNETVNLGGNIVLPGIAGKGVKFGIDLSSPGKGTKGGKGAVGVSVLVLDYDTDVTAEIQDGVQVHGDSLNVDADGTTSAFSLAASGGEAGNVAFNGVFSLVLVDNTTTARLGSGVKATVGSAKVGGTGPSLVVEATDNTKVVTLAGGVAASEKAGVGASVAVNMVTRDTQAIIGTPADKALGTASDIKVNGDVRVAASNDGGIWTLAFAAAKADSTPAGSPDDGSDALDGVSLPLLFGEPPATGKTSIGVAGDVTVNVIDDTTRAYIRDSGKVEGKKVAVESENTTDLLALAGAVAIAKSDTGSEVGIAGSFSGNALIGETRAYVESATVTADSLAISAERSGFLGSLTAAGAGAPGKSGIAVAGSVGVNVILNETEAYASNATLNLGGSSSITAVDETQIWSIAGGVAFGGKVGVGAAVSVNLIGFSDQINPDANRQNAVRAYVADSTVNVAGGKLTVDARSENSDTGTRIVSVTGAGAASLAQNGVAVGGMVSVNIIKSVTEAYIAGSTVTDTAGGGTLAVDVKAADTSRTIAIGGAVGVGAKAGVGVGIGYNETRNQTRAYLDDTDLTIGGALDVSAKSTALIGTATVGVGAGVGSSGIGVAGSASVNQIINTIEAYVVNTSDVSAGGPVAITATDDSMIVAVAGGVAGAAGATAVGAAVSYNLISNGTSAFIDSSEVDSTGSTLKVRAVSEPMLIGITVGGAGAKDVAIGGSVAVNSIANVIDAHIGGTTTASKVHSGGDMSVTASDAPSMYVIAGAGAGSGNVAVGASLAYNYVGGAFDPANPGSVISYNNGLHDSKNPSVANKDSTKTTSVTAYIDNTEVDADGNLTVAAGFEDPILSATPPAYVTDGTRTISSVSPSTEIITFAANHGLTTGQAVVYRNGGGTSIGNLADGATYYVIKISDTQIKLAATEADARATTPKAIDLTSAPGGTHTLLLRPTQVDLDVVAVPLPAGAGSQITSVTAAGAGSGTFAAGAAVSLNFIRHGIDAHISNTPIGKDVQVGGSVNVLANDSSQLNNGAGGAGGAGQVAVGAAVAVSDIRNKVTAYVNNAVVNATGAFTAAADERARINNVTLGGAGAGAAAVGGSLSVNFIHNTVDAHVSGASGQVIASGATTVRARDAVAIAVLSGSGAGAGAGAGAISVAVNDIQDDIDAYIDDAKVQSTGGAVAVTAEFADPDELPLGLDSQVIALTISGSGAGGGSAAGSLALNWVRPSVEAQIKNQADVDAVTGVTVSAKDTSSIKSLALAGTGSGGASFGASVGYNYIGGDPNNPASSTRNIIRAAIEASEVTATAGAVNVTADSTGTIYSAAAGGAGAGAFSLGGGVTLNFIRKTVDAHVAGTAANKSDVDATGAVGIKATDSSTVNTLAGSLSFSGGVSIGAAIATSDIDNSITAYVDSSDVTSSGAGVDLAAKSTGKINAITAGGTFAGLFSAGGAVSVNLIGNTVDSHVAGTFRRSDVDGNGAVTLTAEDTSTIKSLAGQVTGGAAGSVGAAIATNDIGNTIRSYVSNSSVDSTTNKIDLSAKSNAIIESLSAGVAGDGTAAISGAVSTNTIDNTVEAYANSTAALTAAQDVSLTASDTSTIKSLSGNAAGAGISAIGGAAAYNDINNTIKAYADGATLQSTQDDVLVDADSTATIETVGAGGSVGGITGVAGSVVVNLIENTVEAYLNNATVTAKDNVGVLADSKDVIAPKAGTLGVGAVGVGGTVVTSILDNTTRAYVNKSTVTATGTDAANTIATNKLSPDSGTVASDTVRGLAVVATSTEDVDTHALTASLGLGYGVGLNVTFTKVDDTTEAYIDNSKVNTAAAPGQEVVVRANQTTDVDALGGVLAGGVLNAGLGAVSDTTIITNTTRAFITDSDQTDRTTVHSTGLEVAALTRETGDSITAGAAIGTLALAGAVSVVKMDSDSSAFIREADVNSQAGLSVRAENTANIDVHAGVLSASLIAGGGGSFGVSFITNTTRAYLEGAHTNARGTTEVKADSSEDIDQQVGTAAGSGVAGIAGAVTIATIGTETEATVKSGTRTSQVNQNAAYTTATQDVAVLANDSAAIDDQTGTLAIAGLAGFGASVDVASIKNKVNASIGNSSKVSAGRELDVKADSFKEVDSSVVAYSGALAAGVSGAVSVVSIGNGLDGTGASQATPMKDTVNNGIDLSGGVGGLGSDETATKAKNKSKQSLSINDALSTSTAPKDTQAFIGSSAVVRAGTASTGGVEVRAEADADVDQEVGGAALGLLVGANGSVGFVTVKNETRAFVGSSADVSAAGPVEVNANADSMKVVQEVDAMGVGLGAGIGAAVGRFSIDTDVLAHADTSAKLESTGSSVSILADSGTNGQSNAESLAGAIYANNSVEARGEVFSTVKAYTGSSVSLKAGTDVTVSAHANNVLNNYGNGKAGGLVGSGGVEVSALVTNPEVRAALGDSTIVFANGKAQVLAESDANVQAEADQTTGGAVVDNQTDAHAKITGGTTTADVGKGIQITADQVIVKAIDDVLYVRADAFGDVPFNVGGTNEAESNADVYSNATVHVGGGTGADTTVINGKSSVELRARANSVKTNSRAKTATLGVTGNLRSSAGSEKHSTAQVVTDPAREDATTEPGSKINTRQLLAEAVAPHGEFESYLKRPETDANTVVNIVSRVVGTTCKVIGEVVCAWGAFCDAETVCEDIIETFEEILGADVDVLSPGTQTLTNVVNFNSDVTINGTGAPALWVEDPDGNGVYTVTRMDGISKATFTPLGGSPVVLGLGSNISGTGGTIEVANILNDSPPGKVQILAPNGATDGYSTLEFNDAFTKVEILNKSPHHLKVNDIEVYNTADEPVIIHEAASGKEDWKYQLKSNSSLTEVSIQNTTAQDRDITLKGHILNPAGKTIIFANGGDIFVPNTATEPTQVTSWINTRLIDLKADNGTIGQAGDRVYLRIPVSEPGQQVGILRADGEEGVYLDVLPGSSNATTIELEVGNVRAGTGNVDLRINDGLRIQAINLTRFTFADSTTKDGVPLDTDEFFGADAVNSATDTIDLGFTHSLANGEVVTYFANGGTAVGGLTSGRTYRVLVGDATRVQLGAQFNISAVNGTTDLIDFGTTPHGFANGDKVVYGNGTGPAISGLTDGATYYVRLVDAYKIRLVDSREQAIAAPFGFRPGSKVNATSNTIDFGVAVPFNASQPVTYTVAAGGTAIGGLNAGGVYYVLRDGPTTVKLSASPISAINLTSATHSNDTLGGKSIANVNIDTDLLTITNHGFTNGQQVTYTVANGGTAIGGLVSGTTYHVLRIDDNTILLSASAINAVDFTSAGTGAHRLNGVAFTSVSPVSDSGDSINLVVNHGLSIGDRVIYRDGNASANVPIDGLTDNGTYFVTSVNGSIVKLAATTAINLTSAGTAPHTIGGIAVTSVDTSTETITLGAGHTFQTGDQVTYAVGSGGNAIGGLDDGDTYFVIRVSATEIQLASLDALNIGAGTATGTHYLDVAGVDIAPGTATGTHQLRFDLETSTMTGENHRLAVAGSSYFYQVLNKVVTSTVMRIPSSVSRTNVSTALLTAQDTKISLADITSDQGDVTIQAGTTTAVHSNVHLIDTIASPAGTTKITATSGDLNGADSKHLIQAKDINLVSGTGKIGTAVQSIRTDLTDASPGKLDASAAASVWITEIAGDLRLGAVSSNSGNVTLLADGSILDHLNDPASDVDGGNVTLTATKGGIGTLANPVDVNTAVGGLGIFKAIAQADVFVTETSGDLTLDTVTSAAGGVTLAASTGAILDQADASAIDVSGVYAVLKAHTAVGQAANPIETKVANLEGSASEGGFWVNNTGGLTIGGASSTVGISAQGDIIVLPTGPLTVSEDVLSVAGSILLTAPETAGTGDDLTVNGGADIRAAASGQDVTLLAGDNVAIAAGSKIEAGDQLTIRADHGDLDPGTGVNVEILGALHSTTTLITTENDADTVHLKLESISGATTVLTKGGIDTLTVTELPNLKTEHGGVRDTLTLDGGAAADAYTVYVHGSSDYLINVLDTGLAGDGVDTLAFIGRDDAADTLVLDELSVAAMHGTYPAGPVTAVERVNYTTAIDGGLNVDARGAADDVYVRAVHEEVPATVLGGAGNDDIRVGNLGNSLADVEGTLTIDAGTGVNRLRVTDTGGTDPKHVVLTNNSIIGFAPADILYSATGGTFNASAPYAGSGILLEGSLTARDAFLVRSTLEGSTTAVAGGGGGDVYYVTALPPVSVPGGPDAFPVGDPIQDNGNLDTIRGRLRFVAPLTGAPSQLYVNDHANPLRANYTVGPAVVQNFIDPTNPVPARPQFAGIDYQGGINELRVDASDDVNVFDANPSVRTHYTLDANLPVGGVPIIGGGDYLRLDTTGTTGRKLHITSLGHGHWNFSSAHQDVTFESIERFNHVSLIVYQGDKGRPTLAPRMTVRDAENGVLKFAKSAYEVTYRGAVRWATGDMNWDGLPDLITVTGAGRTADVHVYDGTPDAEGKYFGKLLTSFSVLPTHVTAGAYIAVGDVNHDGASDIITGAGAGWSPEVRVWDGLTALTTHNQLVTPFLAYSPTFKGGVRVAAGDLDQTSGAATDTGPAEIVTAPGKGAPPTIGIYSLVDGEITVRRRFNAYPPNITGAGLFVAVGDYNGDKVRDVIVSPGSGVAPKIHLFSGVGLMDRTGLTQAPTTTRLVSPYTYRGGVSVVLVPKNFVDPFYDGGNPFAVEWMDLRYVLGPV